MVIPKYRAERLLRMGRLLHLHFGSPASACNAALLARWRRAVKTLSVADPTLRWASWFCILFSGRARASPRPGFAPGDPRSARRAFGSPLAPYAEVDPGRRMLLGDLLTYLPDNMLLRGDKVLMGASVEGAHAPRSTTESSSSRRACLRRVDRGCVPGRPFCARPSAASCPASSWRPKERVSGAGGPLHARRRGPQLEHPPL